MTGRLESAGIFVHLPELPAASSPASILFAPRTPVVEGNSTPPVPAEFAWLKGNTGKGKPPTPVAPPSPAAIPTAGPGGLPKRVPQAQLLTATDRGQRPPSPGPRDAARARGFLSSFQAGVRRSENDKGEEKT